MLKLAVVREGKVPPDARAPLSPKQCKQILDTFDVELVVQPSEGRCFKDSDYEALGVPLQEDLSDCDILLGVKEVPIHSLIPNKTYLFFSHTIKKQAYNRPLLQAFIDKNIEMIDWEALTDDRGDRLIAFGFYAGLVGAHNGIWTYGKRTGKFDLPRMSDCFDYAEVKKAYAETKLPPMKIVVTGSGRVAAGAIHNLHDMDIHQVAPVDFLTKNYDRPVFTQLFSQDYVQKKSGRAIFDKQHFYAHGDEYISTFKPYTRVADIFINAIFYDKKAPVFFDRTDMLSPDFNMSVIADVTCDIMPDASVPTTLRPSTIADPVYGYDPVTDEETAAHLNGSMDVMAIDNLPSELPRDATQFFGTQLIDNILPELMRKNESEMIRRAMVTQNGHLTEPFAYLSDFLAGKE